MLFWLFWLRLPFFHLLVSREQCPVKIHQYIHNVYYSNSEKSTNSWKNSQNFWNKIQYRTSNWIWERSKLCCWVERINCSCFFSSCEKWHFDVEYACNWLEANTLIISYISIFGKIIFSFHRQCYARTNNSVQTWHDVMTNFIEFKHPYTISSKSI